MTDRELLEAAAKAAGLAFKWRSGDPKWGAEHVGAAIYDDGALVPWNPLADDGDALRLAVRLNLAVNQYPIYENPKHSVLVQLKSLDDSRFSAVEPHNGDHYAATRRAIVRAAAEIGKAMP